MFKTLVVAMSVMLSVFVSTSAYSKENVFSGQVVGVTSGNNLTVVDHAGNLFYVILANLAVPNMEFVEGRAARNYLANRVAGKNVTVKVDSVNLDKVLIGQAYLNNQNLSTVMVNSGLAKEVK